MWKRFKAWLLLSPEQLSERAVCKIMCLAENLTLEDKRQMADYFAELYAIDCVLNKAWTAGDSNDGDRKTS